MKRLISMILTLAILCIPVCAKETTLYSADGREITVSSDAADEWRAVGWYDREQVYTVIYNAAGLSMEILVIDLPKWKAEGWSDDITQVQTTLYSEDGRTLTVWNYQVKPQLTVGWYLTPEEAQTVLYSEDGRELRVWKAQVEDYLAVGWYRTPEEVQTTLYSEDGRELTVWKAQVEDYLAVGWYRTPEEVQTTVYSPDGQELVIWKAEEESYLEQGWTLTPPVIGKIDPDKPMVALTFDDGPGPYTDRILDCLEKYGAKATFYVVGNRLGTYSNQLKREAELGMEIGCHSWSHAQLTTLSPSGVAADISRTNNKAYELTGVYPATVRPPYGSHNASVRSAAGAPFILWSVDTLDWKTRNATSTYNAVINNVKDGDIILMHDIHSPTADAVERIVPALIERGYQLVTVSEMGEVRKGGLAAGSYYSSIRK